MPSLNTQEKEQNDKEKQFVPFNATQKGTSFSDRLKEMIGNRSGRAFAKEVGISYSTLHNYLTGVSSPTLDNLIALSKHSGVDLNWLVTGTSSYQTNNQIQETQSQCETSSQVLPDNIVCVDKNILLSSIETLEEILDMTNKTLQPSGKAEIIWAIYELLSKDDNKASVVKLVRLVV